jgi:hypothetical protein
MAENIHNRIERERKAASADASYLEVYRAYARGIQAGTISAQQKNILGSSAKHPYSDNMIDMVLAAWSSRLQLRAFTVEEEPVQSFLDEFYVRNQLSDLSYDVNYATGRDGNAAIMLRWLPDDQASDPNDPTVESIDRPLDRRPGRVTAHLEDWWDGKCGVWVAYDDQGRPSYAVKEFVVTLVSDGVAVDRKRRTLYFPDHIERYIDYGGGWQPYPLPGEPDNGVVPWTKLDGSNLGLPIVHFKFPRFGQRIYGTSELAGGLLANQDHVNDIQLDLTAAARLLGFQILTATGVPDVQLTLAPGTMLRSSDPASHFGAITPGDLRQLIDAHGTKIQTIARMTSTPIHIITGGDWPAGITLVQADKPLTAKVLRLAATMGPDWATVAHRATELANAFGGANLNEDALITTDFANPEQLDQMAQAQVDEAKAKVQIAIETLSDWQSLVALGLTEEEAKARIKARQQRTTEAQAALAGFAQQQAANPTVQAETALNKATGAT